MQDISNLESDEFFTEAEEEFPQKNKRAAKRRKQSVSKATRKQNLSKQIYGMDWYDNLHQFSKNKIHCSCQLCRFRSVFEPKAQTHSDMMKDVSQQQQLREYRLVSDTPC